jgi:excisionase family DNA binding protein
MTTQVTALPTLLTVEEVADLLRTTPKAIYTMVERAGISGVVRVGRRLLFQRDDLMVWLDERRAASPGRNRR